MVVVVTIVVVVFVLNIGFIIGVQYWGSILGSISVLDVPMNLHLKFHPNQVSNS